MLMVVVAAVIVMMARVLVIARVGIFDLCDMLMFAVLMRLTRAGMMETAPEYRVQQHRCDGKKFTRNVHERFSIRDSCNYRQFGGDGKAETSVCEASSLTGSISLANANQQSFNLRDCCFCLSGTVQALELGIE